MSKESGISTEAASRNMMVLPRPALYGSGVQNIGPYVQKYSVGPLQSATSPEWLATAR